MLHHENEPIALSPEKLPLAQRIHRQLEAAADVRDARRQAPLLVLPNGDQVELPEEVTALLRDLFEAVADGEAVSIVPLHRELSTQEAADLLNISRQGLVNSARGREAALPQAQQASAHSCRGSASL